MQQLSPLSLQDHCFFHLICHLDHYSPGHLALLPRRLRQSLLQIVPPFQLYRLENTAVASGINTDSTWEEMSALSDSIWASYRILDSVEDSWRDRFISYICHLLLNQQNRNYAIKRISQLMFALHKERLEADTNDSLARTIQSLFISVPPCYLVPFRCPVVDEKSIASRLVENSALPKVLEIDSECLALTGLWQSRLEHNSLLRLLVRFVRSISFTCHPSDSMVEIILKEATQSTVQYLKWVQLWNADKATISSITPVLSAPKGYKGLRKLHLLRKSESSRRALKNHRKVYRISEIGSNLFSIICNQTALESISLTCIQFDSRREAQNFCSGLAFLVQQPQLRTLKLQHCEGLPLESLQLLILAQLASKPNTQQYVTFEDIKVSPHVLSDVSRDSALTQLEPTHDEESGMKKHLYFNRVEFSFDLIEWFLIIGFICINTLDFQHCTVTDGHQDSIETFFMQNPNFHVRNFRFVDEDDNYFDCV